MVDGGLRKPFKLKKNICINPPDENSVERGGRGTGLPQSLYT